MHISGYENIEELCGSDTHTLYRATDYRTDFYSLGVTLYELLTGARPFYWKKR